MADILTCDFRSETEAMFPSPDSGPDTWRCQVHGSFEDSADKPAGRCIAGLAEVTRLKNAKK